MTENSKSNLGITSTGWKDNAEIILDIKTAKLISKILKNKWSVNWTQRGNLENMLNDHIEACTK